MNKNTLDRRGFLKKTTIVGATLPLLSVGCYAYKSLFSSALAVDYATIDAAAKKPVIDTSEFTEPLIMDKIELLRYKDNFICRVLTKAGAVGLSVSNNMQMRSLYPIFLNRIQPFFEGKDARDLEQLLEEVYVHKSNYKLQSLAIWVPLATLEFAILDLLGNVANQSIGEVLGGVYHREISVYQANNNRGKSAEESLYKIIQNVESSEAKAVKFKLGGRMSAREKPAGRSEKLIPLVREAFGAEMVIYADSNGSYNMEEAIRIGKICQEYQFNFYEEPVPFDWYEETRQVTQSLSIPIAGGEQEPSMRNFRWLIAHDALDIVQPDLFYFGGMIRSMRVARMAAAKGKLCVPHISGSGLGYLYMAHFVSALSNAGPYHEFKGLNRELPFECPTSDLTSNAGKIKVPTGPGSGVVIDPAYVSKHKPVNT
ncbi:MAG: mandelate racemase/muconate lactonizing enzyme family protein [Bacteroidota bacterium]